jgi:hypothetical protein
LYAHMNKKKKKKKHGAETGSHLEAMLQEFAS